MSSEIRTYQADQKARCPCGRALVLVCGHAAVTVVRVAEADPPAPVSLRLVCQRCNALLEIRVTAEAVAA